MEYNFNKTTGFTIEQALSLEWLETNGLGGYASSTGLNCNTRKYHALLVGKEKTLPDKYVFLSQLEDSLLAFDREYFLTPLQYPGVMQHNNFLQLQEFQVTTHPCFKYDFGDAVISKEILLIHNEHTVLIKYKIIALHNNVPYKNFKLKIRPLLAYRSYHALSKANTYINHTTTNLDNVCGCKISPYQDMPDLFLQMKKKCVFTAEPLWYYDFLYEMERDRGYDYTEDLFAPGYITTAFDEQGEAFFACSLEQQPNSLTEKWDKEIARRANCKHCTNSTNLQRQLQYTGRSFIEKIVKSDDDFGLAVIAGYHWFLEWGRDAMIALPGLTLFSGLEGECLAVLKEFSKHELDGLIPNFLGKSREQDAYNTIDASLWFAWAVQQYCTYTKDVRSVEKHLWITLKNIFINYKNGTMYSIKMDDITGLVYADSATTNLTWMDAVVDVNPVTPRNGYQVEVNALWYNALCFMRSLALLFDDSILYDLDEVITKVSTNYMPVFWHAAGGYLYDYVNKEQANTAIRPNQIFAVSLPYSLLSETEAASVVRVVREHLLTPYGLRTLSYQDSSYKGAYAGGERERDLAYHNGTVWPWLLGHFGEALMKTEQNSIVVHEILLPCLTALKKHLTEAGIGTISEVFSGDQPHTPGGCISQAWSVAEILRLTYLLTAIR